MISFLGTALAYPLRPDGRGGLALVSGVDAVEDSIRAIIESLRGSHLLEPWLGLPSFVFQPIEDLGAIAEVIKDAIVDGDDRVEPRSLRVEVGINDGGVMPVSVTYSIRGDATARTLEHGYRLL
jgi:phage baseplate assembly protein W